MFRTIRSIVTCAVVLALAAALASAQPAVNEQAIKDVAAGTIKEAKASWWGFDATEATKGLQAAINSGVPKLTVDNQGQPWIVDPIQLASNQEIVFEAGVEVVAKQGSFKGGGDSLFTALNKENIILRGEPGKPALLRMHRDDYAKAPYSKAEWRMCVNLLSSRNVQISDLILKESGGDGIYLGVGKAGVPCKDITIRKVVCDGNYRQGISVISAENLLIEDTQLINTGGTAPMAGIDFEPNNPDEVLINCVMRNCVTQGNQGCGYALYIPPLTAASRPVSMKFENCKSVDDAVYAMALYTGNEPAKAVGGSIEFTDCSFEGSPHTGVYIIGKPVIGCKVRLDRCTVSNVAAKYPAETPIVLSSTAGATEDIGGIQFNDCTVRDGVDRNPMSFVDQSGFIGVRDITGSITLERKGERTVYPLAPEILAKWMPTTTLKRVPQVALKGLKLQPENPAATGEFGMPGVRIRTAATYILYAKAGDAVKLRAGFQQVGHYAGGTMPVEITTAEGKPVAKAAVPFQKEAEIAFAAPATGWYRVKLSPGGNYGYLAGSSNPVCLAGENEATHLIYTAGQLFFWVPAGTKEFALRFYGEGTAEGIKAELRDASGKIVQSGDNITRAEQFDVPLPEASKGEAWSVTLSRPSTVVAEDNYLLLLGIPPLVTAVKGGLLRAGE